VFEDIDRALAVRGRFRAEPSVLTEHVNVIRHPAVRVQSRRESLDYFSFDLVEQCAVSRRIENVLTMIAAQSDVWTGHSRSS
jgi:hypothetical protein